VVKTFSLGGLKGCQSRWIWGDEDGDVRRIATAFKDVSDAVIEV
jgi:hypothetical protein